MVEHDARRQATQKPPVTQASIHPLHPGAPKEIEREPDFQAASQTKAFATLRRNLRGFAFPMTLIFLVWYFLFVLMSIFLPDVLSTPVPLIHNVGILFGLLQFVSTFVITFLYTRHASKNLDPYSRKVRDELRESAGERHDG